MLRGVSAGASGLRVRAMNRTNRQRGDVESFLAFLFLVAGVVTVIGFSVSSCSERSALLRASPEVPENATVLDTDKRPYAVWIEGDEIRTKWLVPKGER